MHEQDTGQIYHIREETAGKKRARREFPAQRLWWRDGGGRQQNVLDEKPNVLGTNWKLKYSSVFNAYLKSFKCPLYI